jgi:hypothetical protein
MSNFLNLNWKDILKGFILSIITALVAGVYQAIQTGGIQFTWLFWQPIVYSAIGAGLAYLIKNVLTNSNDQFLKVEK